MLKLKYLVAALTVGTAMVLAPGAATAAVGAPHHATTLVSAKHPKQKHKRKHRPIHKKHSPKHKKVSAHSKIKPVALHGRTTAKPLAARAGSRHSDI